MERKLESKNNFERRKMPKWLNGIAAHYRYDLCHSTMDMLHTKIQDIITDCCFYYCSGSDITPIIAFEGYVHSFIYSDNCLYQNYEEAIFKLKNKLRNNNFIEIQKLNIDLSFFRLHKSGLAKINIPNYKCIVEPIPFGDFSIWRKKDYFISILYLRWDDICVWKNLFEKNEIYPTVICTWQPEDNNIMSIDIKECNLPQYLIGHSIHIQPDLYKEIGKIQYFGDYGSGEHYCIPLYKKSES